jgi:hypothetical protein
LVLVAIARDLLRDGAGLSEHRLVNAEVVYNSGQVCRDQQSESGVTKRPPRDEWARQDRFVVLDTDGPAWKLGVLTGYQIPIESNLCPSIRERLPPRCSSCDGSHQL